MFGVNDDTLIFAPRFEKSMRSLSSENEIEKNLEYHLIKNFNAVSLQFCKKISSYNTEISTKNFEINLQIFFAEIKKALTFATPMKNTEYQ